MGFTPPCCGIAICGICPGKPPALLQRHAEVVAEVSQLQHANAKLSTVNQALTFQVSESFEELILLRELAAHLRLDQTKEGISDVSTILLPQLRRTLRVEAVSLIKISDPAEGDDAPPETNSQWDGETKLKRITECATDLPPMACWWEEREKVQKAD